MEASGPRHAGGQANLCCCALNLGDAEERRRSKATALCSWGCESSPLPALGCDASGSSVPLCFHRVPQQTIRLLLST